MKKMLKAIMAVFMVAALVAVFAVGLAACNDDKDVAPDTLQLYVPDGAPVPFENLIGRPILCIPRLGYLSSYISSPPGLYVAAAFAVLALLLSLLSEKGGKEKKPHKSSSEQN